MKRFVSLALAATLLAACADSSPSPATDANPSSAEIWWTAIPDKDKDALQQKFDPVSAYLTEKVGITFKYKPVAKYDAAVTQFANGDVMLAWFGGLSGVQARDEVPGSRAIAQGAADPKFKSYFIAHKSTGLEKSDAFPMGIADLPFAFGSKGSTSGRLMPEFFLREATKKSPDDFFKMPFVFSGAHDKTARWVAEGNKVKVGALNYITYDNMVAAGDIDPETCRIIWVTPEYADYNISAHPDLDKIHGAGTIDKIQKALIEMKDPKLLAAFERKQLIEAKNEEFDGILEVAKQLKLVR